MDAICSRNAGISLFTVATLAAGGLLAGPQIAQAQVTTADAKCRAAIDKTGVKYASTANKAVAGCVRSRIKGAGDPCVLREPARRGLEGEAHEGPGETRRCRRRNEGQVRRRIRDGSGHVPDGRLPVAGYGRSDRRLLGCRDVHRRAGIGCRSRRRHGRPAVALRARSGLCGHGR